MSSCPCCSGKTYDDCCKPILEGGKPALTAEALMRARYTAHTKTMVPFIVKSIHPEREEKHDEGTIREWCTSSDWKKLEVIKTVNGGADDDEGLVEFIATYGTKQGIRKHHEIANFKKHEGEWFFFDGAPPKVSQVVRQGPKVGRNDPCICGSGKKYKKCCARG